MAGLVPAIQLPEKLLVKVVPIRVLRRDDSQLPESGPVLDSMFPLDSGLNVFVMLRKNQALQAVSLGKPLGRAFAVFRSPANQIVRHADIAFRSTG